jgi:phage anti-repressor protein
MELIKSYNKYLVEKDIKITIIDYVKEVNKRVYNIDISFIDEFLELIEKDDICIPHSMLIKYGVITTSKSNRIKDMIEQYEFEENKDYSLMPNVRHQSNRGIKYINEYTLKPDSFKLCLMRAKKYS